MSSGPRSPRRVSLLIVFAAMALSGCYTYRAVETPVVGTAVRVHVPVTSAATSLGRVPESYAVEGVVVSVGDTLALATQTRRTMGAYREIVQFDTLRLTSSQRTAVELKEFSSTRSVILGVSVTAAAVGAAVVAFGFGGGEGGQGEPPRGGPPTAVVSRSLVSSILGLLGG